MPIHVESDGPVAVVTIDRSEVANAIDRPTAEELTDAFRRFDGDGSLSVAVLTGAGGSSARGLDEALLREYHHGMDTLATGETFTGVVRYASGDWSRDQFA